MTVKVNTTVVYNHFPKIVTAMKGRAAMVVAKAALDIEAHAKTKAPVKTGALRASIQAVQVSQLHWRVTVGADYGIYLEYGTRYMAARPYFQPALDAVTPVFKAAMMKVVVP